MNKIYIPYINSDTMEGKGPMVPIKVNEVIVACKDHDLAEHLSRTKDNIMGGVTRATVYTAIVISETDELDNLTIEAKKEKALSKLSQEERELLGLE